MNLGFKPMQYAGCYWYHGYRGRVEVWMFYDAAIVKHLRGGGILWSANFCYGDPDLFVKIRELMTIKSG